MFWIEYLSWVGLMGLFRDGSMAALLRVDVLCCAVGGLFVCLFLLSGLIDLGFAGWMH